MFAILSVSDRTAVRRQIETSAPANSSMDDAADGANVLQPSRRPAAFVPIPPLVPIAR
jgi:hypothetical protein